MSLMKARRILQFLTLGPILVSLIIIGEVYMGANIDRMIGLPRFSNFLLNGVLASAFLLIGLAIVALSGRLLFRVGHGVPYGDIVKSMQTSQLVRSGPYRFSRNPMILGYLLILGSVGLFLGSIASTLVIPMVAVILLSCWIKFVEEAALEERFGEEYQRYRKAVPFLLPRRSRIDESK